jgi:uncharacterized Fe-S cluster-containing MiaB family protein
VFGFESVDQYARNVLYNKRLELSEFESAIDKLTIIGLTPGAFVFAGLFAYNDLQTHNDVLATVTYLLGKKIFPVLMFQNDQPYTITDMMLKHNMITLLEPLTVAWIIADTIALLQSQRTYWLIADPVGGPPEPDYHIFRGAKITCPACTDVIYKALVDLRKTRKFDTFLTEYEKVKQCECYAHYMKYIDSLPTDYKSARAKADGLLQECCCKTQPYMTSVRGIK